MSQVKKTTSTKAPVRNTKAPVRNTKPAASAPAPAPAGDNWVSKQVQGYIAGAGKAIGGVAYGLGNGVNNVGRGIGGSITNTTRYWGQGVAGYGNEIKDSVHAGGPRVATAGNPLGISGAGQGKGLLPGGKLPPGTAQRNAGKGSASNPLGI